MKNDNDLSSVNLIELDEEITFNLGNDIIGVITEIILKYETDENDKIKRIKPVVTMHLASHKKLNFTPEEEQKYLDILGKKVKNFIIKDFEKLLTDEGTK